VHVVHVEQGDLFALVTWVAGRTLTRLKLNLRAFCIIGWFLLVWIPDAGALALPPRGWQGKEHSHEKEVVSVLRCFGCRCAFFVGARHLRVVGPELAWVTPWLSFRACREIAFELEWFRSKGISPFQSRWHKSGTCANVGARHWMWLRAVRSYRLEFYSGLQDDNWLKKLVRRPGLGEVAGGRRSKRKWLWEVYVTAVAVGRCWAGVGIVGIKRLSRKFINKR
jgi:hypothetical protein